MEKLIRHFNSSPSDVPSLTKRVINGLSNSSSGCFGVRLDELCARDNANVPLVMIQMCAFLRAVGGLHTKGVFRVNGNSRIIENLRKVADSSISNGDDSFLSHLERYGNIHSVASLIKLFLRELPVGLVPPAHTKELLENYNPNTGISLAIIDRVVRSLPPPNYRLLEYLCCFLRQVTEYRNHNQMDSMSIGIVFGPNVFRFPRESEGLSSQNIINEIMSILVERSDVLFGRENTLEVPSAPLLGKKQSGGSLSLSPTSTPDETESGIEIHHRPTDNYHLSRHQPGYTSHSSYNVESYHPRNNFFQDDEIHIGENERYMTPSPTDTDSQSVMNLASDVAEQLSVTLQACLRTCVRQHAFPSLQPTTMPSSSFSQQDLPIRTQQHGPSSNFSTTSLSNSAATTNQWLSGDFNSGSMAAPLLSPLCVSSQSSNTTFTPSSDLRSHSPMSRLNGGNYHNRNQPQGSPLLQIPPPPPPLSASSREEINQIPGGRLGNRSADFPSETPPRHSPPASQYADAILSTKQFTPKMRHDSSWRPIGTSSSGKTERDIERSSNRDNDDKVIHPTESKGLPQYRYPIQVSQEMKKSGNLEDAYNDLVQKLAEKRAAGNRPERLIDMTFAELEAEKLLMQRTLLNFESTYGRPTERNDRILLRPVYDRYRCVKRLLAAGASHNCESIPFTPAHTFAPPDILESAESLSPLKIHTPNSSIKPLTPHSDVYVSIVGSSLKDSVTGRDQPSVPIRSQRIRSSNESFDYHLIPPSSVTSRCTSVNYSINPKSTPDEWFGSLGVSRTSDQRMRHPLRHSDNEENDMAKSRLAQSMHETVAMDSQREEEVEEDETVGRQTPINKGSPRSSVSPPLLDYSRLGPQQQFAKPRQNLLTAQSQTHTQGLGGINGGLSEENSWENYQQSFRQSSRQFFQTPMGSLPQRRQQVQPSAPHLQRQSYQIRINLLTGEDPETGKPLDQAIADYVRKYATFSGMELQTELNSVKESKKTLQKFLKEFEHDFERKNGRKVEADDRQPLNPEYMHYKLLKARLASLERLLEARSSRISH